MALPPSSFRAKAMCYQWNTGKYSGWKYGSFEDAGGPHDSYADCPTGYDVITATYETDG